jgi:hypothetical protein
MSAPAAVRPPGVVGEVLHLDDPALHKVGERERCALCTGREDLSRWSAYHRTGELAGLLMVSLILCAHCALAHRCSPVAGHETPPAEAYEFAKKLARMRGEPEPEAEAEAEQDAPIFEESDLELDQRGHHRRQREADPLLPVVEEETTTQW